MPLTEFPFFYFVLLKVTGKPKINRKQFGNPGINCCYFWTRNPLITCNSKQTQTSTRDEYLANGY